MLTNRKLKKRLQKEADTLMQTKKEELLSFYQPAGEKQTRGRRFPVRALVTISLAVILLAAVIVAASFSGSSPTVEPFASEPVDVSSPSAAVSEASSKPSLNSSTESEIYSSNADIGPGIYDLDDPYAIVEIVEVTDEMVELDSYFFHPNHIYTKIKCRVLFSYMPNGFSYCKNDGRKASGASNYVPFDELQEIYIVNESAADLSPNDVILFQPEEMKTYTWASQGNAVWVEDYRVYYGPVTYRDGQADGQAEFLSFVDGKLVIPDSAFESWSFDLFEYVNFEIRDILEYGGESTHPALFEACPKYLFEEGLTVQQVIEFFNSCQAYREAFEIYGDKGPHFCVIYDPEGG